MKKLIEELFEDVLDEDNLKCLEKNGLIACALGFKSSVIATATVILEAADLKSKVSSWVLAGDDTGMSSKAMAAAATGSKGSNAHPSDPSDLNRCLKLVKLIPEIKSMFSEIAMLSDTWCLMIDRWDELEKTFIDEVGFDWCNGERAPITYALMNEIKDAGRK